MQPAIKPQDAGISVYGVRQFTYSANGEDGLDFGSVVAEASLQQATAVEAQTNASVSALRLRQKKAEDLGKTLALVDKMLANFRVKGATSTDKCTIVVTPGEKEEMENARDALKKYGLDIQLTTSEETKQSCDGCKSKDEKTGNWNLECDRGSVMRGQARIQEMMDTENNDIQQDMVSVQGLVSKRDKSFENATAVVKKFNGTADNIIKAMNEG